MPVTFNIPAPRSYNIGRVQASGMVVLERDWLKYLADDLPRILGGVGSISTLPEIQRAAEGAQATADAAQALASEAYDFGRASRGLIDAIPRFDIRPGSNVTVTRDAQGYVISATGGGSSVPDDASLILAGQVFGG